MSQVNSKAVVATDQVDSYGDVLSPEMLQSLAEQAVGKSVQLFVSQFNMGVGKVIEATVIDNKQLEVKMQLDEHVLGRKTPLFVVPSIVMSADNFKISADSKTRTIMAGELLNFGLTTVPSDKSLTPLEVAHDD